MSEANSNVVIDRAESKLSDLWKKEDYWAMWVGFALLIAAYCIFIGGGFTVLGDKLSQQNTILAAEKTKPYKTIAFYQAEDAKGGLKASDLPFAKTVLNYIKTPARWSSNPLNAFIVTQEDADASNAKAKPAADAAKLKLDESFAAAKIADEAAAASSYASPELNRTAEDAIKTWRDDLKASKAASTKASAKPYNLIPGLIGFGLFLGVMFSIGAFFMGLNVPKFFLGFLGVYSLCVVGNTLGNQTDMRYYGLNAEVWSIALGMLIANTVGTPQWIKEGVQVEYYIKTGLVILGAEVLFDKILAIGIPGIFVAWVVTPIVLVTTFIFGQKVLKMESKTLNIVISADMSVCGTSAAIATASACRAKKEELTLAIGLSLTFTAIMMIAIPAFAKAVGMPEILAGAWIGGTVDSTGAVAAAGALLGNKAMQVAATIKMIQNVLIGVTAFCVAIYWCAKVDCVEGQPVRATEIWHRFPKFVLGFLAASIVFSYLSGDLGPEMSKILMAGGVNSFTVGLRGWFFALAFISIGLACNFRELASYFKGGKPIILYVCGQSLNLCLTLLMAWIMFYKVFPEITANI